MIRLPIRSAGGSGDAEANRQAIEAEIQQSRITTIQNIVLFFASCGLIRAGTRNLCNNV